MKSFLSLSDPRPLRVSDRLAKGLSVLLLLMSLSPNTTARHALDGLNLQIDVEVPVPPVPARADGNYHLAYELHLTNFGRRELTLWRLEVQTDDRDALVLGRYEGPELAERIARPGAPADLSDRRKIGPGLRAVIFIWVTVDTRSLLPGALTHRLTFSESDSTKSMETVIEIARIKAKSDPPVIGPPLRGSNWIAANGPSNVSSHRRALMTVDGRAHLAQRFAIDWAKLGEDGNTWKGDPAKNSSYHAYGSEVLAVADGVVASVKDGIPENVPSPSSRAVPITPDTIAGNYVILEIGGRFALFAHLQPGSLRVKQGDKIKRGQVIGLVGNSGNSTEPHLHFHMSDGNSALGSEGVPFLLEAFEKRLEGEKRAELPLKDTVVNFKEIERPAASNAEMTPEANPADVASIDAILAAVYDAISGPASKKRDWQRFRSLFTPDARVITVGPSATGGIQQRTRDVEEYIRTAAPYLEKNGFFEKEVSRKTETFAHISHVFSTYDSRNNAADAAPFARGINSFQLMNDGKRWWVVTIFWEAEGPTTPIPKEYLKKSKK